MLSTSHVISEALTSLQYLATVLKLPKSVYRHTIVTYTCNTFCAWILVTNNNSNNKKDIFFHQTVMVVKRKEKEIDMYLTVHPSIIADKKIKFYIFYPKTLMIVKAIKMLILH